MIFFFTLDMAVFVCDVIEQFTIRSSSICVFVILYKTLSTGEKNEYLPKLIHSQNDDDVDDDC